MNAIIYAWAQEYITQIADETALMLELEDTAGRVYETQVCNDTQCLRGVARNYGIKIDSYEVVTTQHGMLLSCVCYGLPYVESRVFL